MSVTDSVTAKGIISASLSVNKKRYYITNADGVADIDTKFLQPTDSIYISAIGYKPKKLTVAGVEKTQNSISLSPSITRLKEVRINPNNVKEITLGIVKKKYNGHRLSNPNNSYVQYIPNTTKIKGTISSVEYALNDELHGIEEPFRVRLYTKPKGSPTLGQELTTDSIVVNNPEGKKRLKVDLSKYNIELPENGILVVMETLDSAKYSQDMVLYWGQNHYKTPGIEMDLRARGDFRADMSDRNDRETPYSMVGPPAERWNKGGLDDHWYIYHDGTNFAITINIAPL